MSKKKTNQEKPSKSSGNNIPQNNKTIRIESSNTSNVSLNFLEELDTRKVLLIFSGLIILMLAWVYKGFVFGRYAYMFRDIGSDSYNLIYPQFYHHAAYIQQFGIMPQWSFEQGLGQNVHPFWFDPISSILFLIFKTDSSSVMIWMQLIYMLLAGIFFFLFLKSLLIKNYPAFIGGILYTFCGYVVIGGTWTVDKFPLEVLHTAMLLYSTELYLTKKKWALFPITIALVGIHQPFDLYLYGLMLFVYITVRYAEKHSLKTVGYFKFLLFFLVLGMVGIGLGSFQLWSNLLQMIDSPRVSGNYSYANTLKSSPILSLGDWKQYATVFLRMFSSDILGDGKSYTGWQNYMEAPIFYCGFLSLLLAPQFFFQLNRKQKYIYGILIGVCLLVLIFPYFRYAFWLFTGDYYRTISLLIVCVLLFYGIRSLNFLYENGKVNFIVLGVTTVILLVIVNAVSAEGQVVDKSIKNIISVFLILYASLIAMSQSAKLKTLTFILLGIFVFIEAIYFSSNSLRRRDAFTKQELNEEGVGFKDGTVDAIKYLKEKDNSFYRIEKGYASGLAIHGSVNDTKIQGYYGTRSYHSFNQLNYVKFLESVKLIKENDENSSRWLYGVFASPLIQRLCTVKYFLTKSPDASYLKNANQDSVAMFKDVKVFRLKDTLPLGVTFDSYVSEENFEKLDSMSRQAILLQAVAVNKELQTKLKGFKEISSVTLPPEGITLEALKSWTDKAKQDTLQIKEFLPNLIKGDIQLDASKVLFLAIPHDKGWFATVDGKSAVIEKVDAGLMGIVLEKGKHQIELKFDPPYVREGTYVSIFSLLIWGAGIVFFSLRKKKENQTFNEETIV